MRVDIGRRRIRGLTEEDAAVFFCFLFLTRWDLLLWREEGGPTRRCEFNMLKPSPVFVYCTWKYTDCFLPTHRPA